jgi:pimeloyl-ACP methyl ester carboxylesterase
MTEQKPFWFDRALAAPSAPGDVMVADARIHYETWGEAGNPGIALVHGSNAHLEWWRFVAPFLADQFRVVALDSSGNGDSGWRKRYTGKLLADEVAAVCEAAELGPSPFLVGHSFGGFTVLETGHYHGEALGGIIFMDFTVAPPEQYLEWGNRVEREEVKPRRQTRVYEDKATALGRFRYVPEQPVKYPEVLAYIAEKSLRQVEGGWTWKFDPCLFDYLEMGIDQRDKFVALPCRSAVVLAEDSKDEGAFFADYMAEITGGKLPIFKIPGTYHHLTFDEPVAVAMAIKALCLEWVRQDNAAAITTSLQGVSNQC